MHVHVYTEPAEVKGGCRVLWMVVRKPVGAGSQTLILCKSSQCSESQNHPPALLLHISLGHDRS